MRTARTVPGVTGNDDVSLAEVAAGLRATAAVLTNPDDEPTAAAATRHRIEGAAFALEAVSSQMLRQDGPASGSSFG
ncbi:MAG: hypothetical protein L0I24_13170 [Pseudonocardia sp.]|nr:hypothetical protein [Pseudonocardia sp.]